MAIIVENGTGVKDAVTYGTVQGFKDYHNARGNSIGTISDTTIEQCLVRAADYIDTRWGGSFRGTRRWLSLASRSVLLLTGQPSDGETVTVGSVTYTWKTTKSLDGQAQIGNTVLESLVNMASAMGELENSELIGTELHDTDVNELTVYTSKDGVATTETVTNGSFSGTTSSGYSGHPQRLEFPRVYLKDDQGVSQIGVPVRVKEATYEYALRANSAALAPDPATNTSGLRVTSERVKVGPIDTETRFAEETSIQITKPYPAADRLLREFTKGGQVIRG